jgi:hypothetical protein
MGEPRNRTLMTCCQRQALATELPLVLPWTNYVTANDLQGYIIYFCEIRGGTAC